MLQREALYRNGRVGQHERRAGSAAAVEHCLTADAGDVDAGIDVDGGLEKRFPQQMQRGGLSGVDGVGDGFAGMRDVAEQGVGAGGGAD